jgi:colicin import membrane protein
MKRILMTAALGMLLSAVSVTAQDFDGNFGGAGTVVSPDSDGFPGGTDLAEPSGQLEQKVTGLEQKVDGLTQNVHGLTQNIHGVFWKVDALKNAVEKGKIEADAKVQAAEKAKAEAVAEAEAAKKAKAEADTKVKLLLSEEGPPLWVIDPAELEDVLAAARLEGVFVGIGSASNKKDYQAIQMAEARARQDLAFQLTTQIKAEITDYAKNLEGEKGSTRSSSSAAEEYMVGQQLVETELRAAKVVKRQKEAGSSPDGNHTWWVVVTTAKMGAPEANVPAEAGRNPYPGEEAPRAVDQMNKDLKDLRDGRNGLKPTESPVGSSESTAVNE